MASPEEQQPTEASHPAPHSSGGRRRRGRRGGRRHNRSERRTTQTGQTDQPFGISAEGRTTPELEVPAGADVGRNASAMSRAVDEARQIVESLEQVLEQMEEVQEHLETVERQKSADEREIASLRRALRRVQTPRGHKDTLHEHGSD